MREYWASVFDQSPTPPSKTFGHGPGAPNCPTCKGIGYLRQACDVNDPSFGALHPCICRHAEINAAKQDQMHLVGKLPFDPAASLETFVSNGQGTQAMLQAAQAFIAQPYGFLILHGTNGVGKTKVGEAIIAHFYRQGASVMMGKLSALTAWCKDGYKDADLRTNARYQMLVQAKFMFVDEIAGQKTALEDGYSGLRKVNMSSWDQAFLSRLVDDRYVMAVRGEAHTIFTSNQKPGDIDPAIASRFHHGTRTQHGFRVVENNDQDVRPFTPMEVLA